MLKPRALVAEDQLSVREMFRSFFTKEGWDCDVVGHGAEALAQASRTDYDLILTDLDMPVMGGLELIKEVRASKPEQTFIVVTGVGTVDDVVQIIRNGAADVLFKPIDFAQLRNSVDRIVHTSKAFRFDERKTSQLLVREESLYRASVMVMSELKLRLPQIDRLYRIGKLPRTATLRMHLAVQEAVANAVEHGALELESQWREEFDAQGVDRYHAFRTARLEDPKYCDRFVELRVIADPASLTITCRDPGTGFDLAKHYKSHLMATGIRTYGRGLAIIAGAMDEVGFNDAGNEITMVKYI